MKKGESTVSTRSAGSVWTGWLIGLLFLTLAIAGLFLFNYNPQPELARAENIKVGQNLRHMDLAADSALFRHQYLGGVGGGAASLSADGLTMEDRGDYQGGTAVPEPRESIYVVKAGDTLSEIAEMYGVSANTIVWANDLGQHIHEGQHLVILPFTGVRHQIEKGDSLSKIAKQYEADSEELRSYNNLTDDDLVVGNFIDVKGGVKPEPVDSSPTQTAERAETAETGSVQVAGGYFIRPISGGLRTQGLHGNNAVDLAAPYGTPIYASAAGRVTKSRTGWNGGYGNYIKIAHNNGTNTLYSHNSQNIVSEGQYVQQGQVIGYVGSTGRSTGPHVHFEIHGARNPF